MPKTLDRQSAGVNLAVSSPAEVDAEPRLARLPYLPWVAAAVLGSAAAVLLGWVSVGAAIAVGWLTATSLTPAAVLGTIAQAWVAIHGVPAHLGGLSIGLTPLGLSALIMVAMASVTRFAIGQRAEETPGTLQALVVAGTCTATYSLITLVLATLVGAPKQALSALVGALLISGAGSLAAASRACGPALLGDLPPWLRTLPTGVLTGLAGLTAASTLALVIAIGSHPRQISTLQDALATDRAGAALLVFCYLAYAPTILLWAGSYVLGAGVSLGTGTLLTPTASIVGLLPGLPILGAVPTVPPDHGALFLASGPLAGALAAAASLLRLRKRGERPSLTVGALAGTAAALAAGSVWTAASAFSRGDLGAGRLVGLGPCFPGLLLYGTLPVAAGGLVMGLAFVLVGNALARRRSAEDETEVIVAESGPFGLD